MVPASTRNDRVRSTMTRTVASSLGNRYGGSSRMRGIFRPFTTVLPRTNAATSATATANRYIAIMSRPWTGTMPKTRVGRDGGAGGGQRLVGEGRAFAGAGLD